MRPEDLTRILDQHGIGNSCLNGRICADHWYTTRESDGTVTSHCEIIDLTEYTREQLLAWLGY